MYSALSMDQLGLFEEKQWDIFLPLFLQDRESDPACQEAGRALVDIRKERAVRLRWKTLSALVGRPLPRGKGWAFTHGEERAKR